MLFTFYKGFNLVSVIETIFPLTRLLTCSVEISSGWLGPAEGIL